MKSWTDRTLTCLDRVSRMRCLFCFKLTDCYVTDQPSAQCLLRHKLCDGRSDCAADSDERSVGFGFKCLLNSSSNPTNCIVPQTMVHDDVTDCKERLDVCQRDGRWRYGVTMACFSITEHGDCHRCFRCIDNSMTIADKQVCDGTVDCPDLSDECLCGTRDRIDICDDICDPYDVRSNCTGGRRDYSWFALKLTSAMYRDNKLWQTRSANYIFTSLRRISQLWRHARWIDRREVLQRRKAADRRHYALLARGVCTPS